MGSAARIPETTITARPVGPRSAFDSPIAHHVFDIAATPRSRGRVATRTKPFMHSLSLLLSLLFAAAQPDFVCRRDRRESDGDHYVVMCGYRWQQLQSGACVESHADHFEVYQ